MRIVAFIDFQGTLGGGGLDDVRCRGSWNVISL